MNKQKNAQVFPIFLICSILGEIKYQQYMIKYFGREYKEIYFLDLTHHFWLYCLSTTSVIHHLHPSFLKTTFSQFFYALTCKKTWENNAENKTNNLSKDNLVTIRMSAILLACNYFPFYFQWRRRTLMPCRGWRVRESPW